RFVDLLNNRIAVKTCDDRACVTILYRAMQLLQNMRHDADLYFVATCQEEIGTYGAKTAGFEVNADFGVALDVCHAHTPDAEPSRTNDIDAIVASEGPYINPFLRKKLKETAEEQNIRLQTSVVPSYTSTDLDDLAMQRAGIPSVLIELPLKYMHTSVENIDMHCIEEAARLLANFAQKVSAEWEEQLWI
ncbi:MAG: M20/M25/M40 family metallo-hydrolase, partial [Eubacteriales bacterium]|nr:M20/M25/M40 family metallo-hydrolase [Eubacteriales bacterium]